MVSGLLGRGSKEGFFVNTAFNLRANNFNKHSEYTVNVTAGSGHTERERD